MLCRSVFQSGSIWQLSFAKACRLCWEARPSPFRFSACQGRDGGGGAARLWSKKMPFFADFYGAEYSDVGQKFRLILLIFSWPLFLTWAETRLKIQDFIHCHFDENFLALDREFPQKKVRFFRNFIFCLWHRKFPNVPFSFMQGLPYCPIQSHFALHLIVNHIDFHRHCPKSVRLRFFA